MRRRFSCLLVCVPTLFVATQAQAVPAKNTGSLSVSFPGGGNPYVEGGAGIWWMLTPRVNLGFQGDLYYYAAASESDISGFVAHVGPALRYYLNNGRFVAPYVYGQATTMLAGRSTSSAKVPAEAEGYDVDGIVGFGIEWFATKTLSFAAHVAARVDLTQPGGSPRELRTDTSSIQAQLYF
jgi:hypothetical protein